MGGARSPNGYGSNTEDVNHRLGGEPQAIRVSLHDVGPNTKGGTEVFQISTDFLEWSKLAQDRVSWEGIIACGPEARQNWRNENNML